MKLFSRLKTSWKHLRSDMNYGAKPYLDYEKNVVFLTKYDILRRLPESENKKLEIEDALFNLEQPVSGETISLRRQKHFNLSISPKIDKMERQERERDEEIQIKLNRLRMKHYIELEKLQFKNELRETIQARQFHRDYKFEQSEGDMLFSLPRHYAALLGAASGMMEKIENVEPSPEESGQSQAEFEFSLEDSMRILGIPTKPTLDELEDRLEKVLILNDPEKGGSPYLQEIAITAKNCIERSLHRNDFPEVKV